MHVISKFNACTTITWDGVEVVEEVAVHAQRQGARRGEEEGRECSRHVDFLRGRSDELGFRGWKNILHRFGALYGGRQCVAAGGHSISVLCKFIHDTIAISIVADWEINILERRGSMRREQRRHARTVVVFGALYHLLSFRPHKIMVMYDKL